MIISSSSSPVLISLSLSSLLYHHSVELRILALQLILLKLLASIHSALFQIVTAIVQVLLTFLNFEAWRSFPEDSSSLKLSLPTQPPIFHCHHKRGIYRCKLCLSFTVSIKSRILEIQSFSQALFLHRLISIILQLSSEIMVKEYV